MSAHRIDDSARANIARRGDRQLAAQNELLASLEAAGITRADVVGLGLHLEKSWWGMEAMIGSKAGARIVVEAEGEEIGDDVGYGPARLLAPAELPPIVAALDLLTQEHAEHRFRIREREAAAASKASGLGVPTALTDAEFVEWAWQPLCALRAYVQETAAARAWLLRWYD